MRIFVKVLVEVEPSDTSFCSDSCRWKITCSITHRTACTLFHGAILESAVIENSKVLFKRCRECNIQG